MQKRTKITLASAIVAALATSALVAAVAFAAPDPVTASGTPANIEVTIPDTDNVEFQSESEADDATEVEVPEKSEKAGEAETDLIDHQFEGEETGNNGEGV
jgi:hypothetical protein